jgi:hypothetical protein
LQSKGSETAASAGAKSRIFPHFYKVSAKGIQKFIKPATIAIIVYLFCFGIAMALFPIRPFWNDEWRLIYNIKFKSISQLWGTLDLLQECPRVYLSLLKVISAAFDYSYTSLRLPPLLIGLASIFLIFHLRKKFFPENTVFSYLFILIVVSSQTFTDYLVQVKQYEIDIFLSLVALWQFWTLLKISKEGQVHKASYILLLVSLLIVPYFSYTYPIAIAPAFPIIFLLPLLSKADAQSKRRRLISLYVPLLLAAISILVFYVIDVKNVMADERMYASYQQAYYRHHQETFIEDFWKLFALVGSGFVFELIFGIIGIASFFYIGYRVIKKKAISFSNRNWLELYAVLLLLLILFLFATGKLVGGVARLTAYSVPSISILVISFLEEVKWRFQYRKTSNIVAAILFVALFGNIISTCINNFTYPEYKNRIKTYKHLSHALEDARLQHLPLMVTDGVLGDQYDTKPPSPGQIETNTITPRQIAGADTLCAEVIVKVNPAYKVWDTIPFYYMPDMKWIKEYVQQLPPQYQSVIAGDGIHFQKLKR